MFILNSSNELRRLQGDVEWLSKQYEKLQQKIRMLEALVISLGFELEYPGPEKWVKKS